MIRFGIFLCIICTISFAATEVHACSCAVSLKHQKQQVKKAKLDASTVFIGRVVEIVKTKDPDGNSTSAMKAVFELSRVWKGELKRTISVYTVNGDLCGFNFEKGSEYLVYAYDSSGSVDTLFTTICSRTKIAHGKYFLTDLKYLEKPLSFDAKKGN